jgi:hypothetical protein
VVDERSEESLSADLAAASRHRRELDREMSMSERLAALHELCKQLAPLAGAAKPE